MDQSDADDILLAQLFESTTEAILVPAPVVVELDWLSSRRLGLKSFLSFLADVDEERLEVIELDRADYMRIRELMDRYGDLPLGFVDAAVVAFGDRRGETKRLPRVTRTFTA